MGGGGDHQEVTQADPEIHGGETVTSSEGRGDRWRETLNKYLEKTANNRNRIKSFNFVIPVYIYMKQAIVVKVSTMHIVLDWS